MLRIAVAVFITVSSLLSVGLSSASANSDALGTLFASLSQPSGPSTRDGQYEGLALQVDNKTILPQSPDSRLAKLSPELLQHYELILFVNKSNSGPYAQRLIWFKPGSEDHARPWKSFKTWKVSTGREQQEEDAFTTTPPGVYNLHPTRQFEMYISRFYAGAQMPYSVFLDYRRVGAEEYGIAFHAAPSGAHWRLGSRASGGCIRLHIDHARELYTTLRSEYRGRVPLMEMRAGGTWNTEGRMAYDERGMPIMVNGLKALVIIEETPNFVVRK